MPEMASLIFVLYFCIRNGGQAFRAPVDDALATVDQSLLIVLDENFLDSLAASLVHGEALSRPVAGGAKLFQLLDDSAAVLLFPCPCTFQKCLSADVLFLDALFAHCLYDLGFGCDGGVVGTRQPQSAVAGHALPANEDILQGLIQCVTHVQLSGDVWRGNYDGVRLFLAVHVGSKAAAVVPHLIDAVFELLRLV